MNIIQNKQNINRKTTKQKAKIQNTTEEWNINEQLTDFKLKIAHNNRKEKKILTIHSKIIVNKEKEKYLINHS